MSIILSFLNFLVERFGEIREIRKEQLPKSGIRYRDVITGQFVKKPDTMYQVAVAIRYVDHGDYYFLTCYYTTTDTDTYDEEKAKDAIIEAWEALSGYTYTFNWYEGDMIVSDWEEVDYEEEKDGVYSVTEE